MCVQRELSSQERRGHGPQSEQSGMQGSSWTVLTWALANAAATESVPRNATTMVPSPLLATTAFDWYCWPLNICTVAALTPNSCAAMSTLMAASGVGPCNSKPALRLISLFVLRHVVDYHAEASVEMVSLHQKRQPMNSFSVSNLVSSSSCLLSSVCLASSKRLFRGVCLSVCIHKPAPVPRLHSGAYR